MIVLGRYCLRGQLYSLTPDLGHFKTMVLQDVSPAILPRNPVSHPSVRLSYDKMLWNAQS